MPTSPHPAIQTLLGAIQERLRTTKLPTSALQGALAEALAAAPPPEDRLTPWVHDLVWNSTKIVCRRLGLRLPELPSLTLDQAAPVRDWTAETLADAFRLLDPESARVLRALEARDAREPQVAVQLGIPPRRVGVLARQGREEVHRLLLRLARGESVPVRHDV
jgi:DNA-directed RNA polymerase specialized sigma24 family protein